MTTYTDLALYDLIGDTMQALGPHYNHITTSVFETHEMQGGDWFASMLAYGAEPDALSVDTVRAIRPYNPKDNSATLLSDAAEHGFLVAEGDAYRLGDRGRAAMEAFFGGAQQALATVPVKGVDLAQLADLLGRVIKATEAAAQPPEKPFFRISRRTDSGDLPALPRIDQYMTDLVHFRDDAHPAAWRGYDVPGIAWEAFSYIWEGKFAEFPERLEGRKYPAEKLGKITALLQDKGWIKAEGDGFAVTEAGGTLRQQAEDETNRLFFGPWGAALSNAQRDELGDLLTALRDALNALTEAKEKEASPAAGQ